MNDSQLQELQVKVAFLEDSLSKMSDEFFIQQRELEDLKSKYAALVGKLRSVQNTQTDVADLIDERPPHY